MVVLNDVYTSQITVGGALSHLSDVYASQITVRDPPPPALSTTCGLIQQF